MAQFSIFLSPLSISSSITTVSSFAPLEDTLSSRSFSFQTMALPSNPNNIPQSAAASLNNTATSSNNNNTNHSSGANQNQEVLEATKLKFAEEKSLLKTHPLPKTVFKDHLKGLHWEAVMHIHWAAVHSLRLSMHDQFFSEYHGMLQVFSVLDQATEEDRYQDYTSIARMLVLAPKKYPFVTTT